LLGISKRGDGNLRRLLVLCARALMQRLAHYDNAIAQWTRQMLARRHSNVVACALAAKLARIVWAVLTRGARYHPYPSVA
jgi:transposase